MKTNIRVFVREAPVRDQVFWCIAMTIAITILLSAAIALWQFNKLGAFALGFVFCRLLQGR